jgi:hypothetical protein
VWKMCVNMFSLKSISTFVFVVRFVSTIFQQNFNHLNGRNLLQSDLVLNICYTFLNLNYIIINPLILGNQVITSITFSSV